MWSRSPFHATNVPTYLPTYLTVISWSLPCCGRRQVSRTLLFSTHQITCPGTTLPACLPALHTYLCRHGSVSVPTLPTYPGSYVQIFLCPGPRSQSAKLHESTVYVPLSFCLFSKQPASLSSPLLVPQAGLDLRSRLDSVPATSDKARRVFTLTIRHRLSSRSHTCSHRPLRCVSVRYHSPVFLQPLPSLS
ncbi:hypothetical protein LX32DRAFT_163499 [Colletotrichum zoysiae]|uniref:Uncharacterized protein n=1 Tax=Colletotrichum zoysiae TaxID=1216348 RepID=A0AAD9H6N4_9PEZI|nr:hypothetical protein LX32DRAFT_163499 [Colletotrichum zoysiae]